MPCSASCNCSAPPAPVTCKTLHGQHSLTDTLNRLERLGLIRQRTEQQWSLTAEGP